MERRVLRTLLCCIAAALALTLCAAADIVDSGTCGENLTWTLDGDGVLTISGAGAMDAGSPSDYAPWREKRESITSAVILDGVTAIGSAAELSRNADFVLPHGAFEDCKNMASVTIPDSVTVIGDNAFKGCESLTGVTIPDGMTVIGMSAFEDCASLTSVVIPHSVTRIGDNAFLACRSLTGVTIPANASSIGYGAFMGCASLTDIYYGGSAAQWEEMRWRLGLKLVSVNCYAKDIGVGITLTDANGETVDAHGRTGDRAEEKRDAFQNGAALTATFDAVDPGAFGGLVVANVFVIFYDEDGLMVSLEQKEIDISDPFHLLFVLDLIIPDGAKTLKILMLGDSFEPLRAVRMIEAADD